MTPLEQEGILDRHANMPQPSCSTSQAVPSLQTKTTYKAEDFPSFEEAKSYGFKADDYKEFKELFTGRPAPPQPISNSELAEQGYSSWPRYCLLQSQANT